MYIRINQSHFCHQTPESEDSEEILAPTKRSVRGRKAKPAKEEKAEEKPPADEEDDVDVAPTRKKSFRQMKKAAG